MRERDIEFEEIDYAKVPLDEATIRGIVEVAGGVAMVLNARHARAKAEGWGQRPPSPEEFAKAAAAEPNLLRRPIFVRGKTVIVGWDKATRERWAALAAK